ncbi:MFS transporter [Sphingopyxis sp. MWB1]|uniref:MFS transporter n=1 Tax=Sphingopyxis sp. MWB1 TaxID=1537715 RepID=UPI00190FB21B|nr:MFS transporter [Sphingopyxis sp. MWB1]
MLLIYALAYGGGVVAYTPFLMLFLPAQVTRLAGAEDVSWLGYMIFAGALAASLSGVLSGWLSDRTRSRRLWVAIGLTATILLQLAMPHYQSVAALLWLVVGWQIALNLMLVPLHAWAGELCPDSQKGLLGGLLSIAPVLGAASAMLIPAISSQLFADRIFAAAILTICLILPLLFFGRESASFTVQKQADCALADHPPLARARFCMWTARLLMQLSGAALAAYLYFWLRSIDPAMDDGAKAALFAGGLLLSVGAALLMGRWIDRHGHAFAILAALAVLACASLVAMALIGAPAGAKLAYVLFTAANAAFLALHSSQTLRILPDPRQRGYGIGLFNLTNTAPSLLMPWLAISVVPGFGFGPLFLILALLALGAALLLMAVPRDTGREAIRANPAERRLSAEGGV